MKLLPLIALSLATMGLHGQIIHKYKGQLKVQYRSIQNKNSLSTNLDRMRQDSNFEFVELDSIQTHPKEELQDTDTSSQWHHNVIDSDVAWNYTKGENVVVAVCDSGVSSTHPDLKDKVLKGYNFVNNDYNTEPNTSHGTHVAGIIAGELNSFHKASGIAPKVQVLPLKITNRKGSTSMSKIIACIQYAADHGAKVINVSFTGVENESVENAGLYAKSKGALLVYSAGNRGKYKRYWPDHKNVLIVGATDQRDKRWSGSNYGDMVDLVAPGKSITSTNAKSQGYRTGSGTSYSAPIISAAAALVYSLRPQTTVQEVESILMKSTDQIGQSKYFGAGRINLEKLIENSL